MPALYPPSLSSVDTPGAPGVDLGVLRLNIGAASSGVGIVVNLKPGLAEAVNFGCLPKHHGHDGADQEPAVVQPGRSPNDEKDYGKADNLDEVRRDEQSDRSGRVVAADEVAHREADRKERH